MADQQARLRVQGGPLGPLLSGQPVREPIALEFEMASSQLAATLASAEGGAGWVINGKVEIAPEQLALAASLGVDLPINTTIDGDFVVAQTGPDAPYAVDVTIAALESAVSFDGTIGALDAATEAEGSFVVEGPNPRQLMSLAGLPEIDLPPYNIGGTVRRQAASIALTELSGTFGDSDIAGDFAIDLGTEPVTLNGRLHTERLDLDDIAGLIGLPPDTGPGETANPNQEQQRKQFDADSKIFPTTRLDPAAWSGFDLDVDYEIARITSPWLPVESASVHVVTRDGWLIVDPAHIGFADGTIAVLGNLDATQDPVFGELDMRIRNIRLNDMLAKLGQQGEGFGTIDGRIRLEGTGRSVDELLATSTGQVGLVMTGGSLEALVVEAVGLDIAESLAVLLADEEGRQGRVGIRCAIVSLDVADGVAKTNPVIVDLVDSKITARGSINLDNETLDLIVRSHAKDFSLLSANQPLHIDGPFLDPSVAPAPGGIENDMLGWLLAPLAAIFPFFDIGTAEDSPCGALVAEARSAAAAEPDNAEQSD